MGIDNSLWIPQSLQPKKKWLCVWEDDDGKYLVNENYEYLCAESLIKGDPDVSENMRKTVRSFGIEGGRPVWIEGRKISQEEWEVQMERLLEGKIPDERQEYWAAVEEQYLKSKNTPEY